MNQNKISYDGELPDMTPGDVVRLTGTDTRGYTDRDFEMYVRRVEDGYDIVLRKKTGDWARDSVTLVYNPNPGFYQELEWVDSEEFPEYD